MVAKGLRLYLGSFNKDNLLACVLRFIFFHVFTDDSAVRMPESHDLAWDRPACFSVVQLRFHGQCVVGQIQRQRAFHRPFFYRSRQLLFPFSSCVGV